MNNAFDSIMQGFKEFTNITKKDTNKPNNILINESIDLTSKPKFEYMMIEFAEGSNTPADQIINRAKGRKFYDIDELNQLLIDADSLFRKYDKHGGYAKIYFDLYGTYNNQTVKLHAGRIDLGDGKYGLNNITFIPKEVEDYFEREVLAEKTSIDESVENKNWVVINIEPMQRNYAMLVPVKVETIKDKEIVGWAYGERIHTYHKSGVVYNASSEQDAMNFIDNHKGQTVAELKPQVSESIDKSTDLIYNDYKQCATKLFTALKPYGAIKLTDNIDTMDIYFDAAEIGNESTLIYYAILAEGFKKLHTFGSDPMVTEFIDDETGTVCVKLLVFSNSVKVEVSEESNSENINESNKESKYEIYNDYVIIKNFAGDGWDIYSYDSYGDKLHVEDTGFATINEAKSEIDKWIDNSKIYDGSYNVNEDIDTATGPYKMIIQVGSSISADTFTISIIDKENNKTLFNQEYAYGYNASYDKRWASDDKPYISDIVKKLRNQFIIDKNDIEVVTGKNHFTGTNVSDKKAQEFIDKYLSEQTKSYNEDYTVGGYVHNSVEYKGIHIQPSKLQPGKVFFRMPSTNEKKVFDSVDDAKAFIDNSINESVNNLQENESMSLLNEINIFKRELELINNADDIKDLISGLSDDSLADILDTEFNSAKKETDDLQEIKNRLISSLYIYIEELDDMLYESTSIEQNQKSGKYLINDWHYEPMRNPESFLLYHPNGIDTGIVHFYCKPEETVERKKSGKQLYSLDANFKLPKSVENALIKMYTKFVNAIDIVKEDFSVHCDKCDHDVLVDSHFECPICSNNNLLDNVVNDIMEPNSNYIMIFNDNGIIGIADKTKPGKGHEIDDSNESVIGISKDFYDSLKVTIHDRTTQGDHRGGFTLDDLKAGKRKIVSRLKDYIYIKEAKSIVENYDEKDTEFNDKYFPRVDISKYIYYKHGKHEYAYDMTNALLIDIFKDDDEVVHFGKKDAPYRELNTIGLSRETWNDKAERDEVLSYYESDIESESSALAQDFIKNELPYYQQSDK